MLRPHGWDCGICMCEDSQLGAYSDSERMNAGLWERGPLVAVPSHVFLLLCKGSR